MRMLELSLVRACPVRCVYCPQDLLKGASRRRSVDGAIMDIYTLEKVLENVQQGPKTVEVHFAGFSEPLAHPHFEDIFQAVEENSYVGSIVWYSTGEGLTTERLEALGNSKKLTSVSWHMNAASLVDGKNPIMLGAKGDIWSHIDDIREHLPKSVFVFLKQRITRQQEKQIVDRLSGLRIRFPREITRAGNVERNNGGNPVTSSTGAVTCGKVGKKRMPVILPDGQVSACCNDYGLTLMIGNLTEQRWEDLNYQMVLDRQADPGCGAICHTECHLARPV